MDDLRHAVRLLARSPTFALTAVASLALGIGATTSVFAVVRTVLWRPLPFADPDRLVVAWETDPRVGPASRNEASFANFLDWRERNAAFDHLTALAYRSLNLTGRGEPERLQAAAPSVDFFEMLGVRPVVGRTFSRGEEDPSAAPTAILSHALWMRRFGSDPGIVGRTIALGGTPTTVIGVLPPGFAFEFPTRREIDVWVPRVVTPQARQARRGRGLYVVGRMKDGVSLVRAQDEMSAIASALAREHTVEDGGWGVRLVPLHEQIAGPGRAALLVLLAAGGCLLLIVCANVSTLLMARASARRSELAIRSAIGATGGRLMRHLLSESVFLAVAGGAAGLVIAAGAVIAMRQGALALDLPRLQELRLDPSVVLFAAAVSLASGFAFGLAPARHALAGDLAPSLREAGARGGSSSAHRQTVMAAAEVALAVMLLIAATLLFKSLARLERVDPGFDPGGVLTFQLSLPASAYGDGRRVGAFHDELVGRLRGVGGVESAGAVSDLPLAGSNGTWSFTIEGRPSASREPEADFRSVTAGYFETMRMRLVRGRFFGAGDTADATPTAVLNEAAARRWWPGEDPIGRRVRFLGGGTPLPWTTIVGVVGDVRHAALARDPAAEIYVPQSQSPNSYMYVAVRSAQSPESLARSLVARVHEIDPELPVFKIQPLADIVAASIARPRTSTRLVGFFGLVAVLLSVGGTYGVVAYATSRRTREIGVRLALGAQRRQVVGLLLRRGAWATAGGAVAGTAGAFALARLLESLLFGVTAHDPATFLGAPLTLLLVALGACAVPAWRAALLDPVVVLRAE
jgi:putative ABC transport system permease protein